MMPADKGTVIIVMVYRLKYTSKKKMKLAHDRLQNWKKKKTKYGETLDIFICLYWLLSFL